MMMTDYSDACSRPEGRATMLDECCLYSQVLVGRTSRHEIAVSKCM